MGEAGIPIEMTGMCTGVISCIGFIPQILVSPIAGSWIDAATSAGNINAGFNKIFILLGVASALGIVACLLIHKKHTKNQTG
mgnify:FL=1